MSRAVRYSLLFLLFWLLFLLFTLVVARDVNKPEPEITLPQRLEQIDREASNFPKHQVLLIGDSITQAARVDSLCGLRVLNAGVGGTRVADWRSLAASLVERTEPEIVVYALGINDANARLAFDPDQWASDYRRLRKGKRIFIMGVWPAEPTMSDFSNRRVQEMNAALSKEPGFIPPVWARGLTKDGVHLNPAGQERWLKRLQSICDRSPQARMLPDAPVGGGVNT